MWCSVLAANNLWGKVYVRFSKDLHIYVIIPDIEGAPAAESHFEGGNKDAHKQFPRSYTFYPDEVTGYPTQEGCLYYLKEGEHCLRRSGMTGRIDVGVCRGQKCVSVRLNRENIAEILLWLIKNPHSYS
ncbi:uncharacterized protein LOC135398332 isoform X2 [Ornithodoros turicata]|uniref:uncharacterized protein LOC135398332 isoform X2 n=1 Tax=Ornithodoros turicata TaxID=34597 RepID=UPI0031399AEE